MWRRWGGRQRGRGRERGGGRKKKKKRETHTAWDSHSFHSIAWLRWRSPSKHWNKMHICLLSFYALRKEMKKAVKISSIKWKCTLSPAPIFVHRPRALCGNEKSWENCDVALKRESGRHRRRRRHRHWIQREWVCVLRAVVWFWQTQKGSGYAFERANFCPLFSVSFIPIHTSHAHRTPHHTRCFSSSSSSSSSYKTNAIVIP